jgi:hypothetical protein
MYAKTTIASMSSIFFSLFHIYRVIIILLFSLFFWRLLHFCMCLCSTHSYIDRKKHLFLVKWIIIIVAMMVVQSTYIDTRKKKEREGKDMDGVDLFEKINIVPRLPLLSLDGAQKSLLLFFPFSLRCVLCTW